MSATTSISTRSIDHAHNLGRHSAGPAPTPLTPNWRHLPIGYHGRSGTIVVSGDDDRRGPGHVCAHRARPPGAARAPASTSRPRSLRRRRSLNAGAPARRRHFADHVFGLVLSTTGAPATSRRGGVPLGPFLGKSFAHVDLALGRTALEALTAGLGPPRASRAGPPVPLPPARPTTVRGAST